MPLVTSKAVFPRGRVRLKMDGRMQVAPWRPIEHPWLPRREPPPRPQTRRYRNGVVVDGNTLTDATGRLVGYFREETFRLDTWPRLEVMPQQPPAFEDVFGYRAKRVRRKKAWGCRVRFKQMKGPCVRIRAAHSIYLNVSGSDHNAPGLHGWLSRGRFERVVRSLVLE